MAEHDLVDVAGSHASIAERLGRHPYDQALDRLALEPAERGMGPSNDACRHGGLLLLGKYGYGGGTSHAAGQKSENPKIPSVRSASLVRRLPISSRKVSAVPPPRLP